MNGLNDLRLLQAPLRHMTAQSQSQHEKIAKLQRELREATKEVRSADLIYRKHVLYYARKDCLQLATMMHQKLPVELRELIYELLCVEPDRPIAVGPYYHFRKYDRPLHDPRYRFVPTSRHPYVVSTWPLPRTDPAYAPHIGVSANVDVEIGEVSDQQTGSSQPIDSNDTRMTSGLTERVMETISSTPADQLRLNHEDEDTILPDGRIKEVHTHKPPSDMALPYSHFLDPRYMGPEIAFEIQKMYYARNTFSVCSVEQGILYFLERDSGYNMVGCNDDGTPKEVPKDLQLPLPVYPREHIQNLQVRVKFEQFHSDMPKDDMTDYDKYAYEQRFLRFTEANLRGLRVFLEHRHEHGINVEFIILTEFPIAGDVRTGLAAQCNYVNFLECIRNPVYTMMHDCDHISVKITHYDEGISAFPRDITGIFGLTKEQWEHEKSVHGYFAEEMRRFHVAIPGIIEHKALRGYPVSELIPFLRQRWGMDSWLATRATHPVSDGRYWPEFFKATSQE
ncbi:hypothetical protein CC77DRAFT_1041454 [Alternaria alternata]|uniref:Uncharacterized protein n=1 Tax=Alternaria alternata TaxID=5599 RepID=A0A177DK12_ALTAL|nr:hypothetical protein CC77DRAFT_1041454 [Alternaria alternata]OAG19382.1 hypothetical protein CC77DRAFT_1041454 [Alternaria alternata]